MTTQAIIGVTIMQIQCKHMCFLDKNATYLHSRPYFCTRMLFVFGNAAISIIIDNSGFVVI